jgi:hypothetical protein
VAEIIALHAQPMGTTSFFRPHPARMQRFNKRASHDY